MNRGWERSCTSNLSQLRNTESNIDTFFQGTAVAGAWGGHTGLESASGTGRLARVSEGGGGSGQMAREETGGPHVTFLKKGSRWMLA